MLARNIILDLRRDAAAVTCMGLTGLPVSLTMQRAADEMDRLLEEVHWLRAFAEIPQEAE